MLFNPPSSFEDLVLFAKKMLFGGRAGASSSKLVPNGPKKCSLEEERGRVSSKLVPNGPKNALWRKKPTGRLEMKTDLSWLMGSKMRT